MISVDEAISILLSDIKTLSFESVTLEQAHGRILAKNIVAQRSQPPFTASAMDGYAIKNEDAFEGAELEIVGTSAAGKAFNGPIQLGQAVRIFTGAPVPSDADRILIQENALIHENNKTITVIIPPQAGRYIRLTGLDFKQGDTLLTVGTLLRPVDITLAASANFQQLPVRLQPKVGVLATGNELVLPGETPEDDQIIASTLFGIAGMANNFGGKNLNLGIAQDDLGHLKQKITEASHAHCDILVTLGGASVGEHDLVQKTLQELGVDMAFWKVAMRPGKPMMYGKLNDMHVLGLPGNPVSSLLCGLLYLRPMIAKFLGTDTSQQPIVNGFLGNDVTENDERQDYLRSTLQRDQHGNWIATAFRQQDSSMVSHLSKAQALIIRPPFAPSATKGTSCELILL